MVNALRRNRIPFAYVAYEGEQQGFRRAENIKRTAELKFWFYGQALGFMPADRIVPIDLEIPLEAG
jgi:dipeptidyl aminopeptidase/acylaminoacyl peptidase